MRNVLLFIAFWLPISAQTKAPKIWEDKALEDWATPIAALGVRPGHFTAAEYYAVPADNLKTYPIYRPDKEPPGYWEWLQKQKPLPLVDANAIRSREDWIRAGEEAFRGLDVVRFRTGDPEKIRKARDPKSFEGVWTQRDGSLKYQRWVVTPAGVQLTMAGCVACHSRAMVDGTVLWAAPQVPPQATPPHGNHPYNAVNIFAESSIFRNDSPGVRFWRQFATPWDPDPRLERFLHATEAELRLLQTGIFGMALRTHASPFAPTKIPDLRNLKDSRYLAATATHRLRGPEDVARYAAFISGADPMEFGSYKMLETEQRRLPDRYADEVLYAIGMYLMSLDPPKKPDPAPAALVARGQEIFVRETCVNCHVPPNYTRAKLTLAQGFTPPADHPYKSDIVNISVETDPALAMKTRKGTGFYKIPSLRGLWYRTLLLHDGSVASLEEMFDPNRLKPDHVPGGWKGPGVTKRAIPGHPFGLNLSADEKSVLIAFLRSL